MLPATLSHFVGQSAKRTEQRATVANGHGSLSKEADLMAAEAKRTQLALRGNLGAVLLCPEFRRFASVLDRGRRVSGTSPAGTDRCPGACVNPDGSASHEHRSALAGRAALRGDLNLTFVRLPRRAFALFGLTRVQGAVFPARSV